MILFDVTMEYSLLCETFSYNLLNIGNREIGLWWDAISESPCLKIEITFATFGLEGTIPLRHDWFMSFASG